MSLGNSFKLEQARATEREIQHRQAQITTELSKGWEHAAKYQEFKAKLDTLNAGLSHVGQEIAASPELSVLDDAALQPVPEVAKVLQIVSLAAQDSAAESSTVSAPVALVTTDQIAETASEEMCLPVAVC